VRIANLTPKKYNRCFAFGCSFTNYRWPTWADIIGQDIPVYQNWGESGAGNPFIFNSVIEAHSRYQFTKGDLVAIMWSIPTREDRYSDNKWLHATIQSMEQVYGSKWVDRFALDRRAFLIRDFGLIKATQTVLESLECDWTNLALQPMTTINDEVAALDFDEATMSEQDQRTFWFNIWEELRNGVVSKYAENQDVLTTYQDIFPNIEPPCERIFQSLTRLRTRRAVNNKDVHPTPSEALEYLDTIWPNNTLSTEARQYAATWTDRVFACTDFTKPIHSPTVPLRL
jgi:hypothetical protein